MNSHSRLFSRLTIAVLCFFCLSLLAPIQKADAFFFGGVGLKDEKEMGHKFDIAIRSSLPIVEDPEVSDYVKGLVERIVRAIPPQPFEFKPGVILHNSLNAFAVPGGYIYTFTGLLMNFNSEDEVAGVLCHELAHVTQRHVASRIERSQLVTLGTLLLAVAGAVAGSGELAVASMSAGKAAMLNYSRADETEADQVGMQYLIKAGYSPVGLVNGFKVLRQKSWMSGVRVPAYISTHPDIADRINGISARIKGMPKAVVQRKCDNTKFRRVQLLLWGRYGDAQSALQRFSGQDAMSCLGRGIVLSRLNKVPEATAAFNEAMAKAPGDPLVLREAGIFHYRKGELQRASGLLSEALRRDPHDYMASFFLARLMDDAGNHLAAQSKLKDVLLFVPYDAEVHETLARSYGAGQNTALAYIHMTYAAMYSRKKEQAEKYYEKAKALSQRAPREFKRLENAYKERKEIWKKL